MRQRLEYALAWPFIKALSFLSRPLSRAAAISLAWLVYLLPWDAYGTLACAILPWRCRKKVGASTPGSCAENLLPPAGSWLKSVNSRAIAEKT